MRAKTQAIAAAVLLGLAALPQVAEAKIPERVQAMIQSAAQSGDEAGFDAVVKAAKATNPKIADEIDAYAKNVLADAQTKAEEAREATLRSQGFFDGWGGEGQFGVAMSRGNTHETSATLGVTLAKNGLKFRHTITALVDYARTDGITTREKFNAGYALNYKFDPKLYVYGSGLWERDKFAGYSRRFTESVGIGYSAIQTPHMSLDLEAGPSLRQTRYINAVSDNKLAARASAVYKWMITDTLTFSENASALMDSGDKTYVSTTALTSKIFGNFSARLSFNWQRETNPPAGLKKNDYSTRLTGVYDF